MKRYLNYSKLVFTTIIFLLISFSYQNRENIFNSGDTYFPYALTLLNGNILLVINDGIHFFDSLVEAEETSKVIYFDSKIESELDYDKTTFDQFSEDDGGYIMVLAMNKIYFFDNEGNYIYTIDLSDTINGNYYNLLPYKKEGNYLHYVIFHLNTEANNFIIHHFKFEISSHLNSKLISKEVSVIINYTQAAPNSISGGSCLFLLYSNKDILVCFYSVFYPTEFQSRAFDPQNEFEEIDEYAKYSFQGYNSPIADFLIAKTNKDKEKAFILTLRGNILYKMIFDFNDFPEQEQVIIEENLSFSTDFYKNRLVYFQQTEEFVYVSNTYAIPRIPVAIFNDDFTLKEKCKYQITTPNVWGVYTSTPFYKEENYFLIFDDKNNKNVHYESITGLEPAETEEVEIPTTEVEIPTTEIEIPTTEIPEPRVTTSFAKNIKCKTATEESARYDLCTECDNDNGYFSVEYSDNSFLHGFEECFNMDSKPGNFYFDDSNQKFKQCYETCKTCNEAGNGNMNNCIECENNYIKKPDTPDTTNCVVACNYMYYYTPYGQYKCTTDNKCPDNAKLYIEELKKCTNDCQTEEIYNKKYEGKCLEDCPENTEPNENNICIDINLNSCTKTESDINTNGEIDLNEIDLNAKNYAEDFSYTDKHVTHFSNNLYSILIYKDLYCIEELSLKMPKVDFGNCFTKVLENLNPPTTDNIIIALIEKYNTQKKSSTTYFFYHPNTGEKIDIATICKDEEVIVKESVLSQLNDSNVNLDYALFLADQNIDIFNLSDAFYTDICFHFESPNGKDIPLKDRIATFYPNVTLCDPGCETKGVNLTTMESMCECKFNDLLSLGNNALVDNALGGITNLLSSSNFMVLKCYQDILQVKYFIKNTGGYIFIAIALAEVVTTILFFAIDIIKIFQYLYGLTENFINSLMKKKNSNNKIEKYSTIEPMDNAPPKKIDNVNFNEREKMKLKAKIRRFKIISLNDMNKNTLSTQKSERNLKKSFKSTKTQSSARKETHTEMEFFDFDEAINDISPNIKSYNRSKNINIDIDIEEYLKPDLDDMEYDDAIKFDKRSFCEFYWNRLKDKQLIISLFNYEFLRPVTMKILLLLLNIDLYFVVNGLFYNEEYISNLFHSTEEETFFSFLERSLERLLYATIVGAIVEGIIGFIFIEEKKVKKLFIREKENIAKLKYEIFKLIKSIKKRFFIFIILSFILIIISWYYVNCFNNVYPGVKIEWIKSSIAIVIIVQLIPVITAFLEALLRQIGLKCKSEKIFELRKYFS